MLQLSSFGIRPVLFPEACFLSASVFSHRMCTQVRFVVMGNVFPTEVRLHRKYDLKGSTHGRTAGSCKFTAPDTILKVHQAQF